MSTRLTGKVALVTGAGQGVGRRIAISLAARGAAVAVNDLFADRAVAVAAEIAAAGGRAEAVQADVCSADAVSAMFARTRSELGAVSVLVNNAGVPVYQREKPTHRPLFMETSLQEQHNMVALNLHGPMYCCREALHDMVPARWGKIINIISEAGRAGEARLAIYAAAKAGMVGLTKSLAQEHGKHAINVNAIALGATSHEGIKFGVLSPQTDPATDESWQKQAKRYPMAQGLGRFAKPEDVAATVDFLVSDGAEFITGQTIAVSGGFFMA